MEKLLSLKLGMWLWALHRRKVLITMKRMEEILPIALFQRIHKSYIVSLERVLEFNTDSVFLKNKIGYFLYCTQHLRSVTYTSPIIPPR